MLQNFPLYMEQNMDVMKKGIQDGFTTPRIGLSGVLGSIENLYKDKKLEDLVFY